MGTAYGADSVWLFTTYPFGLPFQPSPSVYVTHQSPQKHFYQGSPVATQSWNSGRLVSSLSSFILSPDILLSLGLLVRDPPQTQLNSLVIPPVDAPVDAGTYSKEESSGLCPAVQLA